MTRASLPISIPVFDLAGYRQHGVASNEVMTSDETQIQNPMSRAKCVTKMRDKGQQEIPEYHVIAAIRRLRTDRNCHAENAWPNHVKNELHIGSENLGPKNIGQPKHNDEKTANKNAAAFATDLIYRAVRK